jgi:DNA-binding NarL/FixJ family response regulator
MRITLGGIHMPEQSLNRQPSRSHTRLTAQQRKSLIAHICKGYTYTAIAKRMGIPLETVRSFAKRRAAQLNVSGRIGIAVQRTTAEERVHSAGASITERQRETLRYLVTGMTNKEIGAAMGISAETVKDYLEVVRVRLKVKSRTALAVITVRNGWDV